MPGLPPAAARDRCIDSLRLQLSWPKLSHVDDHASTASPVPAPGPQAEPPGASRLARAHAALLLTLPRVSTAASLQPPSTEPRHVHLTEQQCEDRAQVPPVAHALPVGVLQLAVGVERGRARQGRRERLRSPGIQPSSASPTLPLRVAPRLRLASARRESVSFRALALPHGACAEC